MPRRRLLHSSKTVQRKSWDDEEEVYRIRLEVRKRVLGFLFDCPGTFPCDFPPASDAPDQLKPVRHQPRD